MNLHADAAAVRTTVNLNAAASDDDAASGDRIAVDVDRVAADVGSAGRGDEHVGIEMPGPVVCSRVALRLGWELRSNSTTSFDERRARDDPPHHFQIARRLDRHQTDRRVIARQARRVEAAGR